MRARIKEAADEAQGQFWAEIAKRFPEIKSGDVEPFEVELFDQACTRAVASWVELNQPRPPKVTITRNGQAVDCYGEWREDSNCSCVFEDECLDEIYADGGTNWEEVVEKLTAYAKRNNTVLVELQSC